MSAAGPTAPPHPGMGFRQFVAFVAALMAMNALSIDSMLPALAEMGDALRIAEDNHRQWIVTAYLLGFGCAQIVYGSLADRFGRKPVLLVGIVIYTIASFAAAWTSSFEWMMVARVVQGIGAAATRVLAVSIVRDCYSGRQMARVMSLSFVVFMAVPIVAPSVGQVILIFGAWPRIFEVLALAGILLGIWTMARLPETLHPEDRMPISPRPVARAFATVFRSRVAVGYMIAMALALGGLFGFINSAQQIFVDVFDAEALFPAIFAMVAGFMVLASLLNARIVGRLGTRRVSHTALCGYILLASIHALVAISGMDSLWTFAILQGCMMFCFGLMGPNFGAMAMEPLGHVAGTAASVQGFITTIGGALIGFFIGQMFDGTVVPLTTGFALCGCAALLAVFVTEKGRLFRPAVAPAQPSRDR